MDSLHLPFVFLTLFPSKWRRIGVVSGSFFKVNGDALIMDVSLYVK